MALKIAAALCLLIGSVAGAQPGTTDAPRERRDSREARQAGERARQTDTVRFRARLGSLLEQLEASTSRLRGAIDTLDADGSMDDAVEQLGGPMHARRLSEMWSQWNRPESDVGPRRVGDGATPPSTGRGGLRPSQSPGQAQGRGMWGARDVGPDEVLTFLREHAPELGKRLGTLREGDSRRADAMLTRLAPRVNEIVMTRAHDPELAELLTGEFRVGMRLLEVGSEYARAVAAGEDELAERLRAELIELAGEQVDFRLARRDHEIATLAARLAALRADVDIQSDNRQQLIDEVVEQAGRGRFRGGPGGSGGRGERGGRGGAPERSGGRDRGGSPDDE